jgi:hypothetical protein
MPNQSHEKNNPKILSAITVNPIAHGIKKNTMVIITSNIPSSCNLRLSRGGKLAGA